MSEQLSILSAMLIGVFGGVHCVGMCGGIVSALSMNVSSDLSRPTSPRLQILLFYNLGRITSYTVAGLLVGGLGWWTSHWLFINQAQQVLQVVAAIFLILLGLYLANWWRVLARFEKAGTFLWSRLEPYGRQFIPVTKSRNAFYLGLIWGWLPCGLVYSMLIWSLSAGSALQGALLMLGFGLGTLPNLLLMGVFAQTLTKWLQLQWLRSVVGSLVIAFALLMLWRVQLN